MPLHAKLLWWAPYASLGAVLAGHPVAIAQVHDPLKPDGVTLGMSIAEADTVLATSGYEKVRDCLYRKRDQGARATVFLQRSRSTCSADETLDYMRLERHGEGAIDGTPAEVIDRMSKSIGDKADCPRGVDRVGICRWNAPSGARHIGSLSVLAGFQLFRLVLEAPEEGEQRNTATSSSAAAESPPVQRNATSSPSSAQSGLALEGVYLGMTRHEAKEALLSAGYDEQRPDALWFRRYEPGRTKQDGIQITYGGDNRVRVARGTINKVVLDYDQRRQELIAKFGPPASCIEPDMPAEGPLAEIAARHGGKKGTLTPTCTWTRDEQGQKLRLLVKFDQEMNSYVLDRLE